MHPDQKYVTALVNNDETLLRELYRNCFHAIRTMVLQNKGTEAIAADLFQDALIDLFRKAKKGDFFLTSSICAYIKGMCRNKWYDEQEKQKRLGVTFGAFQEQAIGEDAFRFSEEQCLQQERLDLIRKKMKELGKTCQALLRLSWEKNAFSKKKTTNEIAAILHVSNGYVRKKKSECIVKLIKLVVNDPAYKNLKE